ncbi:uncharacterized protein I303_107007 [Kwoniella dejecticola CBS 10117]|uniref:Kinetochore protein Mis12/MTW1 n=1 Tax=Kwoniella dejecticola CBS 10117 TaxID=1296121 RepID=A0A1A5ZYG2_9TREE|nr:uncharacterized protein I303_06408 [Kwoniella dejecticola CBS 10117]OBR82851.1 hypothetical protein I303_06408 [Kwoniella dejecticola CBS 10117]
MPPTRTNTNKTPRKLKPNAISSSSKITLDSIPPADVPQTLTPGYVYQAKKQVKGLDEDERARLIHELVGFHPRALCHDIAEAARSQVYIIVEAIEAWARGAGGNNPKYETELNLGLVALETLLESHVDKAFDRFTAWTLRNAFEFSPELEVVLPWQKGLDFQRGEFVASQPKGQQSLDDDLDIMRLKVEQTRLLAQKLEMAEKKLDHKLSIARQRKAEVGFIKEIIDTAGLNPLPKPTAQLLPILSTLQNALQPLEPLSLNTNLPIQLRGAKGSAPGGGGKHTKAWELGRSAYLNWALNKALPSVSSTNEGGSAAGAVGAGAGGSVAGTTDKLSEIESGIKDVVGDNPGAMESSERVLGNQ